MKPLPFRFFACVGLITAIASATARAQAPPTPAGDTVPAAHAAPSGGAGQSSIPPAIPLAEISTRAHETTEKLRAIENRLTFSANLVDLEAAVAEGTQQARRGVEDTNAVLELQPRFSLLTDITNAWSEARQGKAALVARITSRASDCSAALGELEDLQDVWSRTGAAVRAQNAPPELIARVDATLDTLRTSRERIVRLRDRLLALQNEAARQLGICDEMLARLDQFRQEEERELGRKTIPPLWQVVSGGSGAHGMLPAIAAGTYIELRLALAFLKRYSSFPPLQLLLFACLVLFTRHARMQAEQWTTSGREIREHLVVLERPYSVAWLLASLYAYVLYFDAPQLIFDALGATLFIPLLRLLQRILHPAVMRPLYGLAALWVMDRLQQLAGTAPAIQQSLLCLSTAGGLAFMLWSASPSRMHEAPPGWQSGVTWVGRLLGFAFAVALVAGTFGYMNLARLVSSTAIVTVTAAMTFFVVARVLLGLWDLSLGVRPLAALRMVKNHRTFIARRSATIIYTLAVAAWLFRIRATLAMLGLKMDTLKRISAASVNFGSVTFSLGDFFFFGITLWGSVLLSRFLRFVLDEEIFPRSRLAQGLPYALSNLIHYAILTIGLLLALATLGFDASRLTVMIGALGVGIGFGLQAIVNNFVSGLILLLERPIKTGDTVQVGQVTGEVRRIGVRSSTVHTSGGAEVIVPNSTLISDSVTNWTLSDRSRRFELPIGVASGAKPAGVMTLMKEVAKQHPEVLAHPEPSALFLGFEKDSLNFELRAWVGDGNRLSAVKSEVALSLCEALEAAGMRSPSLNVPRST